MNWVVAFIDLNVGKYIFRQNFTKVTNRLIKQILRYIVVSQKSRGALGIVQPQENLIQAANFRITDEF